MDTKVTDNFNQSTLTQRPSLLKSHACGSLFANCNCSARTKEPNQDRRKTLFQSYSHPDTSHVFTDENKNGASQKTKPIKLKGTKITERKRLSSPNIGNYSVLDVAVHPEVVLTVSHANGQIEPRYAHPASQKKSKQILKNVNVKSLRHDLTKSLEFIENKSNLYGFRSQNNSQEEDLNTSEESVSSLKDGYYPVSYYSRSFDDNKNEYRTNQTDNLNYFKYSNNQFIRNQIQSEALGTYRHKKSSSDLKPKKSFEVPFNQTEYLESSSPSVVTNLDKEKESNENLRLSSGNQPPNTIIHQSRCSSSDQNVLILEDEVLKLKDIIKDRDCEIIRLKREIHKLKSVLQQTTINQQENGNDATEISMDINSNKQPLLQSNQFLQHPVAAVKKQGVSGESSDATGQLSRDISIRKYDKDYSSKQLIKSAIMDNDFLKHLDSSQIREVVDSMYGRDVANGEYVIREGEAGAHLFVSAQGDFEVIKEENFLGKMGPGKAFGELAILYNCTRTASIRVLCDSKVWVLDRRVFQQIMMRTGMQRIEENVKFLKSVPLLKNLSNNLLAKIADVLELEFFPVGTYVIRQGASGDTFYLISQGTVKVTQKLPGSQLNEDEIRTLGRGDYFGEQALLKEDKRTANIIAMAPGVECLTLDRESFTQLIGDLCELHERDYGDETRFLSMKKSDSNGLIFGADTKQELLDIDFEDLDVVATLGIGGFGRVELVKCVKKNSTQIYALKCLKKYHIVDTHQEEHVFSERSIMLACNSPFICRLYRTYRDERYVYMLLEACMGGEVWTILRNRGYFDDTTTQFIIGCVLQAFDYLHARGIVYRDLKPENLMLDVRGYIKLVDFGFAKYIGYSSKTWTFCGTPEYVAPEIILNKGHDRAVDYWALGILIYELLTGTPPFTSTDPMKTYNIILKGIDMIDFPKHMSRSAIILIKRLCRDMPCERLGYQRGGIQLIQKHKWFQGFDWDGLESLSLIAPFHPRINGPMDTSNFDYFPKEEDDALKELSGWDQDF